MKSNIIYRIILWGVLSFTLQPGPVFGQASQQWDAGRIYHQLEKLQVVGSALYIAAHPDDENTRLISYLSNDRKVRTGYLSLTRGDGGQNLIGPELRESLGVIRTQELLAARDLDGGKQFFTRANDFGYSKTPDETLEIWDEEKVLHDMVWVIRKFRPDIVVNRFDHRTEGSTHGHHTSSAMLSLRAFEMAGDRTAFPEQLEYVDTWKPKRIFFNTSWWFYGSREAFAEADKSNLTSVDVGVYYPLLGKSNNEIAYAARSKHRCQGFGTRLRRGDQTDYLELIKGEWGKEEKDILDPIDISWGRLYGGTGISNLIKIAQQTYDPNRPEDILPLLLEIRTQISTLDDPYWREAKLQEIEAIIKACAGFYLEAVTDKASAVPGDSITIQVESTVRRPMPVEVSLERVKIPNLQMDTIIGKKLALYKDFNQQHKFYFGTSLPEDMPFSTPYWLKEPWTDGMYTVKDLKLIGKAQNDPAITLQLDVRFGKQIIRFDEPLQFKRVDPAIGELYDPFAVTPSVFINPVEETLVVQEGAEKEITCKVKAMQDNIDGRLTLSVPDGWIVSPKEREVRIKNKYDSKQLSFSVRPDTVGKTKDGKFRFSFDSSDGKSSDLATTKIDYEHIPIQYVMLPSEGNLVSLNLKRDGKDIAYIMGAGDQVPQALEQVGYSVKLLSEGDIRADILDAYDAVVIGIRAYNTLDWLSRKQSTLFDYVKRGGTLITQYSTSYRIKTEKVAPLPLKISRGRVTDETAPVQILKPNHPVLHYPNQIDSIDFQGWVQERGLYFAGERDSAYIDIIAMNDKGEDPLHGSLTLAEYGKGIFVYTGLSWFRQLPAGVPGAYRLFANLLALKQENESAE
jgi:LmbE family N-acetylglucosaminyl deacetylase